MPFDRATPSPDPVRGGEPAAEALPGLLARVGGHRDREAFAALFAYFAPRLKNFYLRRGVDGGAAEDLAQETMLRIWHHAGQFDPARAAPAAWVFGIARNLRVDTLRRRHPLPEFDLPDPYAPENSPETAVIHAQQESRLRAALHDLPGPQRDAVRAAYFEGLPHSEAHQVLGIALGTLKSRLRLALTRLRDVMGEPP